MCNGPSVGCNFQLFNAHAVMKNQLDGKLYIVIVRQVLQNTNLYKTLLVEYKLKVQRVRVYLIPKVFVINKFMVAKESIGCPRTLGILWDSNNNYLDFSSPTKKYIKPLGIYN